MTTDDTFGQTLSVWLHEEAGHRVPDHLGEVLVQTVATRQRPWWSSPERWLPVDTATDMRGRIAAPRSLVWLALIALVVLAIVGTAVITGTLRAPSPAVGLAPNGRFLIADGTTLKSYAADGTDPQTAATLPYPAQDLVLSHDGTRLGMIVLAANGHMDIMRLADFSAVTLPVPPGTIDVGSAVSFAPDDQKVAFVSFDGTREHLLVAPADGSSFTELDVGAIGPLVGLFSPAWSPDGHWVAFIATDGIAEVGDIWLIRPDGTELHKLAPASVQGPGLVRWSPDPTVQRLLFTHDGNSVAIFDVATAKETTVGGGFWGTWSPDGSRVSYWTDGTVVTTTAKVLAGDMSVTRTYPPFSDGCQANPDRATTAFCGPARWSPDGMRLYAPDIVGTSVVSFVADGTGSQIVIPLGSNVKDLGSPVVWLPVR
jgi:WD40 repeat protein